MTTDLRRSVDSLLEVGHFTAQELTDELLDMGLAVEKAWIDALLYSNPASYINDGETPPRWSNSSVAVTQRQRSPHRLTSVGLSGWKSFDEQLVELGEITLMYGENSTGKSSIIQAILAMKQCSASWAFRGDGPYVNFGLFNQMVHGHDSSRDIQVTLSWGQPRDGSDQSLSVQLVPGDIFEPPEAKVRMLELSNRRETVGLLSDVGLGQNWLGTDLALWAVEVLEDTNHARFRYDGPDDDTLFVLGGSSDYPSADVPRKDQTSDRRAEAERTLTDTRAGLKSARATLDAVEHIGPFRAIPTRSMSITWADEHQPHIARLIEDDLLLGEVNEWLTRFEMPYRIEIRRYDEGCGDITFGIELRHTAGGRVQVGDVGFGVSQLLPVILTLIASRESTILVEEPEAHLHPRLQSILGDLFITSSQDYGNVIVAETHSEPLLLRLQRRIAERRLAYTDVSVLHVIRAAGESTITEAVMEPNGRLDYQWPGGFFDDRFDDLVAILDPHPVQ